ncbi:hypothetical protein Tco_0883652 [Tanacetum coccineum]
MNHQTSTVPQVIPQVAYQSPQALAQLMTKSPFVDSGFAVPVFSPRDDPIACLNKAMAFLTAGYCATSSKKTRAKVRGEILKVGRQELLNATLPEAQEVGQILDEEQLAFLADPRIPASQAQTVIPHNAAFQTEDLDTYDSDCDDLSTAQAVLMANISNYGFDVVLEATVQDTNLQAQQDSMILSVIEQMSEQMINHVNNWEKTNKEQNNEIQLMLKLSAEQAFWFHIHNPSIESSYTPPVIMEVPSELPKVSLVNASLKKLKFHLTQFDSVVKKRTTPNALEKFSRGMVTVMNSMSLNYDFVNMKKQKYDSCEKCLNLDAELSKSKQAYNDLLKNHSQLEKNCISLEVSMQLKQEVFQNDKSCVNHNAVEIQDYFEINDLKAQRQHKDTTISKLKDTIKSLKKNIRKSNVHHEKCDQEPLNEQLETNLKAQIQDKVFVITSLKNNLRKSKGKEIVENVIHIPSATTITPGMFKLDLVMLPPRLLQNREVHINYLTNTQEQANILRGIVKQVKAKQPLDGDLDLACNYATSI